MCLVSSKGGTDSQQDQGYYTKLLKEKVSKSINMSVERDHHGTMVTLIWLCHASSVSSAAALVGFLNTSVALLREGSTSQNIQPIAVLKSKTDIDEGLGQGSSTHRLCPDADPATCFSESNRAL